MWRRLTRSALCIALAALAASGLAVDASAQWKPERNVELVVGTGPGGAFDRTARMLQRLWKTHHIVDAPTIVSNKPGAGQSLALAYLDQQAGNGHYLSVASGIIFSNHLTGKTRYAYTDFTPIAILYSEATVFAVKSDGAFRSARDLLERLRKDPHGPSFAVGSTLGSATHISSALVLKAVGGDVRKMKAVVFNSSGDSVAALLGGHVDVVPTAATLALPHVQAGRLRLIAVASAGRLSGALADVPTWKELGVDAVAPNWRGVFGAKAMTPAQIAYWEQALARTVNTAEWQEDIVRNSWEPLFLTGREARKFLDGDHAATKTVLTELGLVK